MKSRHRRITAAATAAVASLALVAAVAQATPPPAPYQDFAGCPSPSENEFVAGCLKIVFENGQIGLGKRSIPVTSPITLRGGYEQETGNFLFNSEGGLIPVRQPLGGGFYATLELAGQPGSVEAPTRTVPSKVHFEGPNVGPACYVGSTAAPIALSLTTGTTSPPAPAKPITGTPPSEPEADPTREGVEDQHGGVFVDNTYRVPGASGCTYTYRGKKYNVNGVVNRYFGIPAAGGQSTTELGFSRSFADPRIVYSNNSAGGAT